MRNLCLSVLVLFSFVVFSGKTAFSQENETDKEKSPEALAAKEAERLEKLLKLEDWQVFYVDSTLQHDYKALMEELNMLQKSKVENYDIYTITRDKWMSRIDSSYMRFFDENQWKAYLKSGAAREQRAREKRKAKIEKNTKQGKN